MPSAALTSTQSAQVVASKNVQKSQAPSPPRVSGQGSSGETSAGSMGSFPDVTAGIADIYNPGVNDGTTLPDSDQQSVIPDYPMDSLPRHSNTSTQSLPNSGTPGDPRSGSTNLRSIQNANQGSRPHQRPVEHSNQAVVPHIGLSSSTGSIPNPSVPVSSAVISHVPAQLPSHSIQATQPDVSHSNVSVNVSHLGPVSVSASDARQIRTQDLNVGVVTRLDHHRQSGQMLPDVVAHSQPPNRQSSSQRPQTLPLADPRHSSSRDQRRPVDPYSRHRHRRDHRHRSHHRQSNRHPNTGTEEPCKESCLQCLAVGFSFRWILVVLSLLGVCCVVTGIVLAALHAAGNSFLFLAIMFIGLGVLLVVVVGVGWKCTPRGHEPLHALFSIGEFRNRRSSRRRGERRNRRWHEGSMHREFRYRPPPPTYNASMVEYQQQQQQLAAQQAQQSPDIYDPDNDPDEDYSLPSSPPPSYRSRASTVRAGIQITFPPNQGGDYPDSRPPTYRSHQGRHTRPSLSRDDDSDHDHDPAPADFAFTGSSVIVDTNTSQNSTSIQISPAVAANQNVTVSVTTVSVTTSQPTVALTVPPLEGHGHGASPAGLLDNVVDPIGERGIDRVDTQL
ncbi:uncharacterized protein LOC128212371 [Mya arenaria]|uniref:uncharacterized protein LOC128212371 n=1 Tax=Mya arenaria TaxID=6604 RepID=UPI0022E01A2D|nr:uncharacterized protein LOC128212371 [Mya arenaria]XP_052773774.1 uncharacterized protein LOC128212371 [Mya arenaria]XP_052773781.1 uncharacterized protein LOC128212371 [Mya arenaria]